MQITNATVVILAEYVNIDVHAAECDNQMSERTGRQILTFGYWIISEILQCMTFTIFPNERIHGKCTHRQGITHTDTRLKDTQPL